MTTWTKSLFTKHKKKFYFLFVITLLLFNFRLYFIKEYRENPLLYLVKQDLKEVLNKERIYVDYYHINELKELYKKTFNNSFPYTWSDETGRLNDLKNGGQPFWKCIKSGKLYTTIEESYAMLTYRNTNQIGTCELSILRLKSGLLSTEKRSGTLYFDKRVHIPIGKMTNHYCLNKLTDCLVPEIVE